MSIWYAFACRKHRHTRTLQPLTHTLSTYSVCVWLCVCRQGIRNRRVLFEVTAAVAFAFKCNWLHFAFSCFSSFPWYFVFFFFYFSIYLVVYLFVYFGARRAYHVVITTFCNVNERARAAVGAVELLIDGRIRRWWQHFRMHPYTVAHTHTHTNIRMLTHILMHYEYAAMSMQWALQLL